MCIMGVLKFNAVVSLWLVTAHHDKEQKYGYGFMFSRITKISQILFHFLLMTQYHLLDAWKQSANFEREGRISHKKENENKEGKKSNCT